MKEAKALFTERRSVNFFDPNRPLEAGVLKEIIDLAATAPSAFNLQPWKLIAVTSPEAKQKLFDVGFQQAKIKEAPVTLVLLADKEGFGEDNPTWGDMLAAMGDKEKVDGARGFAGMLYGTSDVRKLKFAESNAGLFAMSIMYAAQAFGVESHAMSGMDFDGVKAAFGVEDRFEAVMLISLGYLNPGTQLYPRMNRRGYDQIVTEA